MLQDFIIYFLPLIFFVFVLPTFLIVLYQKSKDKKYQKTLKKEIDTLNDLIEKSNDALFIIDIVNGRILKANYKASELLNYKNEELLDKTIFDLHPKELLSQSSEKIADAWEKKGLIYSDLPFLTKEGDLLPVECSTSVINFSKRPVLLVYARDISERLVMQNKILTQNQELSNANKEIRDSILYAERIQKAMLASQEQFSNFVKDCFILFIPKDIVSGDFYWMQEGADENTFYIAAIDCTGHGVPGAMMSMIGNTFLKQIVTENKNINTDELLNKLREKIVESLKQDIGEDANKDGMDMSLVKLDKKNKIIQFSGANNPLYLVRNKSLEIIKGDSFPIGMQHGAMDKSFSLYEFNYLENDAFYLFSDGYADQFGGKMVKNLSTKGLSKFF